MSEYAAQYLSEQREAWCSLEDLWNANFELDAACRANSALRHARRIPKSSEFRWLKVWEEEWLPAMIYAHRHLGLDGGTRLQLTAPGTPAADVILERSTNQERIDVTIAHPVRKVARSQPRDINPGWQEALRAEKLNADGWVSSTTSLVRNKTTKHVEYSEEQVARPVEDNLDEWVWGLQIVLDKKRRNEAYGEGATLLVYGSGMSGDFLYPDTGHTIFDIVSRLDPESFSSAFDKTIVMGWHAGWYTRI